MWLPDGTIKYPVVTCLPIYFFQIICYTVQDIIHTNIIQNSRQKLKMADRNQNGRYVENDDQNESNQIKSHIMAQSGSLF